MRDGKLTKQISFCLLTLLLGFAAGGIVWFLLQAMQIGIELIWTTLPDALHLTGGSTVTLVYNLIVCFIGAILIALVQKHYGPLPDTMEEVLGSIKRTGAYPHNTLHHIAIAALLPLIFGGALGPEAGLTGLIVGICYWIGDNLKYRNEQITALAEAGFAAIVGVIFYLTIEKLTRSLADKLSGHFFLRSFIAAAAVAVAGAFLPMTMFSGEHDLKTLIDSWQSTSPALMILTAIVKLALVSFCINFGWRGGSIFPIIFSGALLGYTFALIVGMDGAFAVVMLVSSMYAYIMRKPAAVVMILLLCFPITYIFPIAVSAILASKISTPFGSKSAGR